MSQTTSESMRWRVYTVCVECGERNQQREVVERDLAYFWTIGEHPLVQEPDGFAVWTVCDACAGSRTR